MINTLHIVLPNYVSNILKLYLEYKLLYLFIGIKVSMLNINLTPMDIQI